MQGQAVITRPDCVVCDDLGCEFCPSQLRRHAAPDERVATLTGALQDARREISGGASVSRAVLHASHACGLELAEADALARALAA